MSVIAEVSVPADGFELGRSLKLQPGMKIELERMVPIGGEVLPLLRVIGNDGTGFEKSARGSQIIENITRIDNVDDKFLYKVSWSDDVGEFFRGITEMDGTLIRGVGTYGEWRFQIRFDSNTKLSNFHEHCDIEGIAMELESANHTVISTNNNLFGLTQVQRETLLLALRKGYFKIPRETTLVELAEELGISDQALSERMRRSMSQIITNTLIVEPGFENSIEEIKGE
ncbi:MAG: helix-turn-helix domain-containing protein [Halobacteria archaeon]|nr:helix-turn-helix domain-containing protein [Halobacteria archaeon]